ncbi:hypothetical protein KKC94_04765 [Patescibacteria group bacterium]|nr:hypothetical protein [Patescibacteria group bacterium]
MANENQNELGVVLSLIDRSTALEESKKPGIREFVKTLSSEDLARVRINLENENNFIENAFQKGVTGIIDLNINPAKDLNSLISSAKKIIGKKEEG